MAEKLACRILLSAEAGSSRRRHPCAHYDVSSSFFVVLTAVSQGAMGSESIVLRIQAGGYRPPPSTGSLSAASAAKRNPMRP